MLGLIQSVLLKAASDMLEKHSPLLMELNLKLNYCNLHHTLLHKHTVVSCFRLL